jgi:hypothetical protein
MQEYRYKVLVGVTRLLELFGVRRPLRFETPIPAGEYDQALHVDHPDAPSLLDQYLESKPHQPKVGGAPRETTPGNEEGKDE